MRPLQISVNIFFSGVCKGDDTIIWQAIIRLYEPPQHMGASPAATETDARWLVGLRVIFWPRITDYLQSFSSTS